jgi:periplasmic protein CpxP/Spy
MKQAIGLSWKKWTMGVLLLVLFAALMSAASILKAQDRPSFGEHHPPMERALGPKGEHARWWNEPGMIAKLNLTEAQRKDMDGILDQQRLKLVDLHANVEKAELTMEPLMKADQPDETKILAQIDRIADARKELEKANARFLLAIRSKLTPEQWKQLEAMRAARHEHGRPGERRGPGGPDGRGGNWQQHQDGKGWRGGKGPGQAPAPPPNGPDGTQKPGPGPNADGSQGEQE